MGSVNLDNTGSGSAITLSSDGTSLLLNGTAIGGGGGADLYAANEVSVTAQPSATGNDAVAIGDSAVSSGANAFAIGNTAAATAELASAFGYGTDATGQGSLAVGYLAQATTSRANAIGWARASGADSFAAAIANNTSSYGATGSYAISMGMQSRATASDTAALGTFAYASGTKALALGYGSTASGTNSIAIGDSTAEAYLATSFGQYALSNSQGKYSYASGRFGSTEGSAQQGTYVLRADTTDATPEGLTTRNNGGVQSDNQVNLPNNSAYAFTGTIVARESAGSGTECAAWKVEGLIRREGSAGTTVLVNSATTVLNNAPSWGMALSADTTNGALAITVTGAAKTIRWVGTITTSELIHA